MNSNHKTEWTEPVRYVGLDVSKARLDYAIEAGKPLAVPNTGAGRAILIGQLQQLPGVRVVCEASGGYEAPLLQALAEAKVSACRVPPGRVRHFARAEGTLAKTDRIDVQLLCRYAQAMHPRETKPLSPECRQLRELLDYRRQLSEQLTLTKNRFENAGPTLHGLLAAQREHLDGQLGEADRSIAAHLKNHEELQRKAERLQQLQGVGPVLAAHLLAYLPELGEENDKRLAALVGVAPHPDDSGLSSRPRHTQGGRAELRTVLYMAAVSASQHNPVLAAFYQRLRTAGKPPKVCLVAVMRKMISVLNRMLHDPNFTLVS
jgi:transposase